MTALIIVLVILSVLAVLLLLPIGVKFDFDGQTFFKVKYAGITVYKQSPQKEENAEPPSEEKSAAENTEKENFFLRLKNRLGVTGTIKALFGLVSAVLSKLKKFLRYVSFKVLKISIAVGSDNAAATAIEYGSVCTAVYPAVSIITSVSRVKFKQVDIRSDFNSESTTFVCSAELSVPLVCGIVLGVGIMKEIYRFKTENNL